MYVAFKERKERQALLTGYECDHVLCVCKYVGAALQPRIMCDRR